MLNASGNPASSEDRERQSDDQAERRPENAAPASPVRSRRRRAHRRRRDRGDDADEQARRARRRNPAPNSGRGRNRPRLLRMPPPGSATLPRSSGSDLSTALYQNKSCSKQRHVADQLDIAAGEPRDQPIARQPRDADGEAEHGRQHDADAGDQQRVEQADPERAAEGRRARRIGDQRLADVEAGGVVPEAKAGGDVGARQVLRGVDTAAPYDQTAATRTTSAD